MAKKTVGFRFHEEVLVALGALAHLRGQTRTDVLQALVMDAWTASGRPMPKEAAS